MPDFRILVQQEQPSGYWLTISASEIRGAADSDEAVERFAAAHRDRPDHGPAVTP